MEVIILLFLVGWVVGSAGKKPPIREVHHEHHTRYTGELRWHTHVYDTRRAHWHRAWDSLEVVYSDEHAHPWKGTLGEVIDVEVVNVKANQRHLPTRKHLPKALPERATEGSN
jgi:hypothetical protein